MAGQETHSGRVAALAGPETTLSAPVAACSGQAAAGTCRAILGLLEATAVWAQRGGRVDTPSSGGAGNAVVSGGSPVMGGNGGVTAHGGNTGDGGSAGAPKTCQTTRMTANVLYFELADFDSDGWLDLLMPSGTSTLLRGSAQGFSATNSVSVPDLPNAYVRATQMNGDGFLDLVALGPDGDFYVLLGDGAGQFSLSHHEALADVDGVRLAVGDFKEDGAMDVVFASMSNGEVGFLAGDGKGALVGPVSPTGLNGQATDISVADLNEDGHLDLAVASAGGVACDILLGDGAGQFMQKTLSCEMTETGGVAIGRIDGDAHQDVAFADRPTDKLGVYLGQGNGEFTAVAKDLKIGDAPAELLLLDFNADGKLDAVTGNANTRDLSLALGNGDGTFQAPHAFKPPATPGAMEAGDVNRDGYSDLVVSYGTGIVIYYGPCAEP